MLNSKIISRLELTQKTYDEISDSLAKPEILKDINRLTALSKQKNSLEKLVKAYLQYKNLLQTYNETEQTITDFPELKTLAQEDLKHLEKQIALQEQNIKTLILPKDANDSKNIICEIKGAAGGDEANIFAGDLFEMYLKYAELEKWKVQVLDLKDSESGGFAFIAFKITGKNVYAKMKYEAGGHRVQRVPKTESKGRVHTSIATVAILPEVGDVKIDINPNDLRINTYRSSGAGGQHVNKTDSAVRITHIPTGIVVTSQDGRSQHDNRALAMEHLKTKLYSLKKEQQHKNISDIRKEAVGKGDRSEKIRTYNYPQNRVTDHRLNQSWNKLNLIIEGQLDQIILALINYYQQKELQEFDI